jgi:hypothetical protein
MMPTPTSGDEHGDGPSPEPSGNPRYLPTMQGNIADLAESLVRTAPRGTTVTVVSEEKPEA